MGYWNRRAKYIMGYKTGKETRDTLYFRYLIWVGCLWKEALMNPTIGHQAICVCFGENKMRSVIFYTFFHFPSYWLWSVSFFVRSGQLKHAQLCIIVSLDPLWALLWDGVLTMSALPHPTILQAHRFGAWNRLPSLQMLDRDSACAHVDSQPPPA